MMIPFRKHFTLIYAMILTTYWEPLMRKILPYLVLNIIVSAATVLLVLVVWQQTHKKTEPIVHFTEAGAPATAQPRSTLPALDEPTVEIQLVVGAGELDYERVQLVSASDAPVELTSWELTDGKDLVYTFPFVKLYPGGSIHLFSKAGTDTSIELFWKKPNAVWSSGDLIELIDPDGNTRAQYRIP